MSPSTQRNLKTNTFRLLKSHVAELATLSRMPVNLTNAYRRFGAAEMQYVPPLTASAGGSPPLAVLFDHATTRTRPAMRRAATAPSGGHAGSAGARLFPPARRDAAGRRGSSEDDLPLRLNLAQ